MVEYLLGDVTCVYEGIYTQAGAGRQMISMACKRTEVDEDGGEEDEVDHDDGRHQDARHDGAREHADDEVEGGGDGGEHDQHEGVGEEVHPAPEARHEVRGDGEEDGGDDAELFVLGGRLWG